MPKVIVQPDQLKSILRKRRITGADQYDEVWNGVYVMAPLANNDHQQIGFHFARALFDALGTPAAKHIFHGVNVSDQSEDWTKNYRCPDVAAFLPGTKARDCGTHWLGGPDFAVEILSPRDRARKKFAFYAAVGVRELMLLDRRPWRLELYRHDGATWSTVGTSAPGRPDPVVSEVVPLSFRLIAGEPRPQIEVAEIDGPRRWFV